MNDSHYYSYHSSAADFDNNKFERKTVALRVNQNARKSVNN